MSRNIWLDVSTIYRWSGPAAGIIRTELECARHFLKSCRQARFCRYIKSRGIFCEVPGEEVRSVIKRLDSGTVFHSKLKQLVKKRIGYFSPQNREKIVALLSRLRRVAQGVRGAINALVTGLTRIWFRLYRGDTGVVFSARDVYITLGLDWDDKDLPVLYAVKKQTGMKVLAVCYDIIPVKYPQFCYAKTFKSYYSYFVNLARCADKILCISENTRKDLAQLLESADAVTPRLGVIRLGSEINRKTGSISTDIREISKTPPILYVSTIERRKNHEVLYRAYTHLLESGRSALPPLVFVGRKGGGVDGLISDLDRDTRIRGLILRLDTVTDKELDYLYSRALFTVFPSLYEGWGLPVAESLAHGKFCIASGASSLPEVGGRFVEYIDPSDLRGWIEAIAYYIDNPAELRKKEEKIRESYKPHAWSQTVRTLVSEAIAL